MLKFKPSPLLMRFFALCLCFFLVFSLAARPIVAHASMTATVTIAAYGVAKIVISAKVLVGLIIGSFSGFVLSALLPEVDSWYESDPVVRNWADRYNGAIAGGEVISIPADVQQAIRDKFAVPASVALSTLYVPYDLMHLEKVSAVHVFGTDVAAQLEANNALLQENITLLDNIKAALSQMAQKVNDILAGQSSITTALNNVRTAVVETKNSLKTTLLNINQSVGDMKNSLKTTLLDINESVGEMKNSLKTTMLNVVESLDDMRNSLKTTLLDINESVGEMKNSLKTTLLRISESLNGLPTAIGDVIGNDLAKINTSLEVISAKLDELLKTGTDVTTKPNIEVVAGTQTIVVSDYATMGQAFSAKMGWIPQIFDFLAELRSRLNSGTAPKVAIDLSDAEGSYNYGGKVYVLDMSWYARYKPSVDTFLSGVMWICFGWAIYKRIPDIISGVGLTVENATETRGHVWADRAEREASLSYRQERRSDYYAKKNNKGG